MNYLFKGIYSYQCYFMEPFDIQLSGVSFAIQPLVSGNFEVYQGRELIGFLTPTVTPQGTIWNSREIGNGQAQMLGEQIEIARK